MCKLSLHISIVSDRDIAILSVFDKTGAVDIQHEDLNPDRDEL